MNNYTNVILNNANYTPKTILEIGSRDGHDSNTLKLNFNIPDNDVWVVEPNPNQISFIKKTYPNFNLIEKAIHNRETTISFNCVEDKDFIGVSSILDRNDNFYNQIETKKITVNTITGEQLLNIIDKDIDLCKIDVEGLTYEVLESFNQSINKIKSLHLECEHVEIWKKQKLYTDIEALLILNNFKRVYFNFIGNENIQSDSIWICNTFLKS
jgi:FkbM family methyltransferase